MNDESKLAWILRQLITSETPKKRPLPHGLALSWHPAGDDGICELWIGRRDSQPSEQEDRTVLGELAAAAKAEGLTIAEMRMSPGQHIRGRRGSYGVTIFRFRLYKQPPLPLS
ncbi:MAG: hypothetical protein R6X32_05985 [Chloroflexota bacterium]